MPEQRPRDYFLLILSLILYAAIGYGIERHQTLPLLLGYFLLFTLFLTAVRQHTAMQRRQVNFWILASIGFRVVLLFSVPALSDDFYRFIWDGRLIEGGFHPFAHVPSWYMRHPGPEIPGINEELFSRLNSRETYTIYPPFAQFIFWLSVRLSDGSITGSMITMKVVIFLFEIATIYILQKILLQFSIPRSTVLLYALNPLVILELTGNLHYEGVMIFFLFTAIYFLRARPTAISSAAYALSVCTKLVTLLFLPLLVRYLGWAKAIVYWVTTAAITLLICLPLLDMDIIRGMSTSLGYYFQRFEFNASLYYVVREIGYIITGFNIIQYAGPALAVAATTAILLLAFHRFPEQRPAEIDSRLFHLMLWSMSLYLVSTAILHPWYIITLLAISLLTPYRFPLLWSALVFLSYAGYTPTGFRENLPLVAFEYIAVIAYLLYETRWKRKAIPF